MKIRTTLVLWLLTLAVAYAQVLKPAKWTTKPAKTDVKAGEEIDLIFTATIDKDWYLYSSDFDPDLGPTVTTFTFKPNDSYELVGKIKPIKPKKKYDELWGGEYTYFTGMGEFRQRVKVRKDNPTIEGSYEYQVCSDVTGQCIPFTEDFAFTGIRVATASAENNPAAAPPKEAAQADTVTPKKSGAVAGRTPAVSDTLADAPVKSSVDDKNTPALKNAAPSPTTEEPYSLATFMALAFLAGLAALLTPCVFPMIPMTVSFFTHSSADRKQAVFKAFLYGLSIIALYVLFGTLVSLINGPGFANFISTHWLPNVLFFLIFLVFGLSFLGLFDINIPGSLITKVDAQADKGGYGGVFFMAFTIVLVSFSCTGPIVGSILVESAGGQVVKPVAGMLAFSSAFALPFGLFAVFPECLRSLPKSGGWLNSVKIVLGFLELALALKFLSVADQVYHWDILNRDVFLALWIVIFSLIGFYLLGKIKLASDADTDRVSVPRIVLAIATFAFVVYLVPGMFGAPLKPLAGYLPPQTTQDFAWTATATRPTTGTATNDFPANPRHSDILKLPHGLNGFFDYDEGLAYARKVNKPVFIDFTGHGCVNCRKMEASVWSNPAVLQRLANDYVVIALYIDERRALPESDWYTSAYDQKVKKTVGEQNTDYQIRKFNNNAQPFYVLLDHAGEPLIQKPIGYTPDAAEFASYLDTGLKRFAQRDNALARTVVP